MGLRNTQFMLLHRGASTENDTSIVTSTNLSESCHSLFRLVQSPEGNSYLGGKVSMAENGIQKLALFPLITRTRIDLSLEQLCKNLSFKLKIADFMEIPFVIKINGLKSQFSFRLPSK